MDSNPSVPLPAAQAAPSQAGAFLQQPLKVSNSNSSGSFPIRAPPSYDSDVETAVKTDGNKFDDNGSNNSSSSDDSSVSEGFVSGEEDFESASERPFVGDPDDETLEVMPMEGANNGAPLVEEQVVYVIKPVGGSANISARKIEMPIAQLSGGDDEVFADEGMVSETEDDGRLSAVRIPRVGGSEKNDVVVENPKLGPLEAEEREENGPLVGGGSSAGGEVESGSSMPVLAANGLSQPLEHSEIIEVEDSAKYLESGVTGSEENVLSIERVAVDSNPVPGPIDEASAEMSQLSKDDVLPRDSKLEEDVNPAELPVAAEDEKTEILSGDHIASMKTTTGDDSSIVAQQPVELVEASAVVGGGTDKVNSLSEQSADLKFAEEFDPQIKEVKGPVEMNGSMVAGSDKVTVVDEESTDLKRDEADIDISPNSEEHSAVKHGGIDEGIAPVVPVVNHAIETMELEPHQSKAGVMKPEKDNNSDMGPVSTDHPEDALAGKHNGVKIAGEFDQVVSLDEDNNKVKPREIKTDYGAGCNEVHIHSASDGVESESSGKVDKDGGNQNINSTAISAEPNPAQEAQNVKNGDTYQSDQLEETCDPGSVFDIEVKEEAKTEVYRHPDEEDDDDDEDDEETEGLILGSSAAAKRIMKELERGSGTSLHMGADGSRERSHGFDGQIISDSDEEVDTDEEGGGKELFDSAALAALLKAASGAGSDSGNITITSSDGSRLFSLERPAGLGSSLRSLKPAPRPNRPNLFTSDLAATGETEDNLSEEEKKKLEKIQLIRVKFLRLVQRLGHSAEDSIAAQVLYRLTLAAGRQTSQAFSLDTAKRTALQLETEGKDALDFSLNILVLGKTGVGKSATINSIFGEQKTLIDAFEPATTLVKEITGTVDGVKIRFIDTPGLRPSVMEQGYNRKILLLIKKFTKKCPPDIVLYVDRLDTQTRDLNDLPLLRSITSVLGSSIWRSAIVTLTHAASAPPDGPSGSPLSYEVFVAQRTHVVQQSVGQAVGDLRLMNPSLMNPVSLVENHPSCRKNREGERILPNGQIWRSQLLFLCYSMKILAEASSLSKPQDPFDHKKLFGFRVRSPPLPYLLSTLLQSRAHPKLPADQGGENGDSDDLGDLSDTDQEEEEDEYDQLPPFKPLRKSQVAKLSKEQRKAYFEEYDYRVRLLQKKQLKDELKRLREIKKGKVGGDDYGYIGEDVDQENGSPAAVPVPLPDMVLPPSFDSDNPAYRYRFLEPTSQLLARPVLDTHGWDHDCGYDGVSLEENLAIAGRLPAGIAVQITKDKKEFSIHLDSSVAAKHGENGSSLAGFDIQTIGKQLAYILRGETKFRNFKKNKTTGGFSVTFLGENVATGLKIEDQITVGKRLVLVGSTGAVRSQGDMAYGANLEARLREKDYPIGQDQSTLGLSLMKWRGDLALGANLQSQISIGRNSKMAVRVGLNNKLSGQITVRTSSSEQLQIALVGLLPIAISIFRSIWPAQGESYSAY